MHVLVAGNAVGKEDRMKRLLTAALATFFASCSSPPVPTAPDMGPIGDGLSVIGFSLIAVAVVITIGRIFR
jgi:ABC-type Co2+ transport system permease subunit